MRHITAILTLVLALGLLLGPPAAPAWADSEATDSASPSPSELEQRREAARVERLWNIAWRQFVPYYIQHEEAFVCIRGYDRKLPSSTGKTVEAYRKETVWEQAYTDERGKERTRELVKPEEDARAAVALIPEIAVGQYGYIHSGEIDHIMDDKTLELSDVWLVDAAQVREDKREYKEKTWRGLIDDVGDAFRDRGRGERRNRGDGIAERRFDENDAIDWAFEAREEAAERQRSRSFRNYDWVIKGYRTNNLKEDARWPTGKAAEKGLQLVIVAVDGGTVTAVPAASIGRGLNELQFLNALEDRGFKKPEFVEIVSQAKREHRSDYIPAVLAILEGETLDEEAGNDEVELAE